MIPNTRYEELLKHFLAFLEKGPKEIEEILIANAVGRSVSPDVEAVMDDPPYSKSTADGYLLLSSGTAMASPKRPMTFESLGDIPAPSMAIELPPGKSVRVKNGSYMAIKRFLESHFAVVKEGDAHEADQMVYVTRLIEKHENIVLQGSVRKMGNTIFQKGHRLEAGDIAILGRQGIVKVKVAKPPKVAVISTGAELISAGTPYKIGCKYDANAALLSAMITTVGGLPISFGIVPNDTALLAKKLVEAASQAEMIVLSGAIYSGGGNWRSAVFRVAEGQQLPGLKVTSLDAAKKPVVSEVNIEPTLIGMIAKKMVICLPGEQESLVEGFQKFAAPMIARLLGEDKK
jgi:molybdopterin molybdotransferase